MFNHITAALAAPPPVRRGSLLVGSFERAWWRALPRQEAQRLVLAARRYELTTRARGKRNGALGHVALEALSLLANLASTRTGRLEPSLAYIMGKLKRSRAAVVRALAALKAHGFLDWRRRFERVERDGPGPQIRQASNAYRLETPPQAARLIPAPPPLPDIDRPEPVPSEEVSEFRAMLDGILASLGRESAEHSESGSRKA